MGITIEIKLISINPVVKQEITYELFLRRKNKFLMTDVHEPEVRSYNMSQIRSKDTKPEMIVRKFLHKNGLRFRLHVKELPGKPDILLPKYKTVIFVNGCFWHGHRRCKYFKLPETRATWWKCKIERNMINDEKNMSNLRNLGYNVIIIWECEIKNKSIFNSLITDVKEKQNIHFC